MRIIVKGVEIQQAACVVQFDSPYGHAWGYWHGETPRPGQECDVELDVPAIGSADASAYVPPPTHSDPSLFVDSGRVILVGCYTADIGGNHGVVRLGKDIIIVDGSLTSFSSGSALAIDARYVKLFPFEL